MLRLRTSETLSELLPNELKTNKLQYNSPFCNYHGLMLKTTMLLLLVPPWLFVCFFCCQFRSIVSTLLVLLGFKSFSVQHPVVKMQWKWHRAHELRRREGLHPRQLRKLLNFSGETLMIQETTLEKKHYKIMLLVWLPKLLITFLLFMNLRVIRQGVCRPSSGDLWELLP